ncbi:MAG: aminomethyl-transferring glycine dehydrogenase subunit GcvPB, partial [Parvibaculum sp.]|nr:aminomethyl-transferring glycine dehydrogenase subunit GcvPB [Parvibaculum sp.]
MSGMNRQGRPSSIDNTAHGGTHSTFTGNKALEIEEPLIFETGHAETTGVDLPDAPAVKSRLGNLARQ